MAQQAEVSLAPAPDSAVAAVVSRPSTALSFAAYMAPFAVAVLVYETLRGLFHYRGEVHVADLVAAEARYFTVETAQGPRVLSELIASTTSPWLDVLCGATYLVFLLEVLGVTAYLFARARPKALELSLGFLFVNLLGWSIWFLYPAAPPWYVDDHGVGPVALDVISSPAGLARLDALLHVPIATTFYSKSANVFGAMPSLHVAYATLVAVVVHPLGGRARALSWAFGASMAYSAVYLRHHYLLDVVAGVLLAVVVGVLTKLTLRRLEGRVLPRALILPTDNLDCGGGA